MDVRRLASEISHRYLALIDPCIPHADNVFAYLRPLVLLITIECLSPERTQHDMINSSEHAGIKKPTDSSVNRGINEKTWKRVLEKCITGLQSIPPETNQINLSRRSIARLDAFVSNCSLALSADSLIDKNSDDASIMSSRHRTLYCQIDEHNMALRLELYIWSVLRFVGSSVGSGVYDQKSQQQQSHGTVDECVIDLEPMPSIRMRASLILDAFVATVGCVVSMRPILRNLLEFTAMEFLAVDVLGGELHTAIKRVVTEYEMQTSFASIAFLSSPEKAARSNLVPLVLSFIDFLKCDWNILVHSCELERMLRDTLGSNLRHTFKTMEFHSIGHVLDVCHYLKQDLESIELPPISEAEYFTTNDNKMVKQALRDLRRETITVNGRKLPSSHSMRELVENLTNAFDAGSATLSKSKKIKSDENVVNHSRISKRESDQALMHQSSFDIGTIDNLTRRLLIASCRTGAGGDAFFVIRDLFGDGSSGDVEVRSSPSSSNGVVNKKRIGSKSNKRHSAGTIEITVHLTYVNIKVHGSYSIYPKHSTKECEPLIQFHASISETISLQSVRASEVEGMCANSPENETFEGSQIILREKVTESTGKRILSVRPAKYVKVKVWNTPS